MRVFALVSILLSGVVLAENRPVLPQPLEHQEASLEKFQQQLNEENVITRFIDSNEQSPLTKQQHTEVSEKKRVLSELGLNLRPVSVTQDHIFGNPDAPVSLVEYSDFECPFCKLLHPTIQHFLQDNPTRVNWVYRHFPLDYHNPGAEKQAQASECAAQLGGNAAFWRYTDQIFARTRSNGEGFALQNLLPLASEIGLNEEAFRTCLVSGSMAEKVEQDRQDGLRAGIRGTPGLIFVKHENGQIIVSAGALPKSKLQSVLDHLLSTGKEMKP
ncbi:MAG: DsbA family protein [gamma proteobacterium symbiont of Bathyaustriella thionipta]|nr:DsbA family protein [gamma proteobacterium symbiont of Bathyaustriella thionipta]